MGRAEFRFYAQLNDFLPPARRQVTFEHRFDGLPSVKDRVEALGVPHTEVDLILVNGRSVGFSCRLRDGDRVSVYPVFETLDIAPLARLRPAPLRVTRFVLDTHLGKLAAYLRLLGFDTVYRNRAGDEELAQISGAERRILLTRDRGLLKRNQVTHGYCLRSTDPRRQLEEVMGRFGLVRTAAPFTRCLRCGGLLEPVDRETVLPRLPPPVAREYSEFFRCPPCDRLYWKGTHYAAMRRFLDGVLDGPEGRSASRDDPGEGRSGPLAAPANGPEGDGST